MHRNSGGKHSLTAAIARRDTAALFDWLVEALSYQGIADRIAYDYMQRHGRARWARIMASLARNPPARSSAATGGSTTAIPQGNDNVRRAWPHRRLRPAQPPAAHRPADQIGVRPVPVHARLPMTISWTGSIGNWLRWIPNPLTGSLPCARPSSVRSQRLWGGRQGLGDGLVVAAAERRQRRPLWRRSRRDFVAVDTLVHNFVHRTGILRRLGAEHPYGVGCYRPADALTFSGSLAATSTPGSSIRPSPRRFRGSCRMRSGGYCAENGLDVCNGNRIDDRQPLRQRHCQLFRRCDRVALRVNAKKSRKFNDLKLLTTTMGCSICNYAATCSVPI